jgi:hypothetical protein
MRYLDRARLDAIDAEAFRAARPYPWVNPEGLLCEAGYRALLRDLPDVSRFERSFGQARKYGQASHDRYALEWHPDLALPDSWREFIEELRGPVYARFLARLLDRSDAALRFHWHYTPRGCLVSPHCDARRKLGSHIFYFNSSDAWDPSWGGETLLLDDHGRFHSDSSPDFADFDEIRVAECLDNRSLIFQRRGDSWHGVRRLECPEGRFRKVFIAVFEKPGLGARLRGWASGPAASGARSEA